MAYITDGLQLYLDAKDGSGTQTIWIDKTGNGHNGTLNNFNFGENSQWTGDALLCDGIDDFISVEDSAAFVGDFTVEIYASLLSRFEGDALISQYFYDGNQGWVLLNPSNGIFMPVGQWMNDYTSYPFTTTLGQYYHYVIRYTTGEFRIYIDGELFQTITQTLTHATGIPLVIGARTFNTGIGTMDAGNYSVKVVRWYNRVLTEAEVTQNYNDAVGATTPIEFTIDITEYTAEVISDESGKDSSIITFKSTHDLQQWEARAGGEAHGQGLLVGSGGAVTSNTDVTFTVDDEELTQGDIQYKISVYGQNTGGVWNG